MRKIDVSVTIQDNSDPVITEWVVMMTLIENGIPIQPFTQLPTHGELRCEYLGNNRRYEWTGEDWRQ